jgi:hypothetical protein
VGNGCEKMTNCCMRMKEEVVAADYIGQRQRSDGGMMQSSTDMGEDNSK